MRRLPVAWLTIRLVLAGAVLGGLGWAATRLDWRLIGTELRSASLAAEIGMAVTSVAALFIRPFRLRMLLASLAPQASHRYWMVWSADVIAMAINSIVPLRAGDMSMAFVLRQGARGRTARLFSTVVIDRIFDFAMVIVIFISALSWAPAAKAWSNQLRFTLIVVLAVILALLWLARPLRSALLPWSDSLLARLNPKRAARWRAVGGDLFGGIAIVKKPRVFVPVSLITLVHWGVTATSYWLGILAVWPSASFAAGALVAAAIALSFVVPVTPGGIGVFHATAVVVLALFQVPPESALAFAIIVHAFQLTSVLALACVALLCQGISIRSLTELRDTRI